MTGPPSPTSLDQIPPEMAELDQWVLWRMEARRGQPKPTKVPYRADGRGRASSTDPATWGTMQAALESAVDEYGVGFVFAPDDGLWGLDLDKCCPEPFGPPVDEAFYLVHALDTYCEYSPSGTGLHAICRAVHPAAARNRAPLTPDVDAEAYDRGRYFTFTGARLEGSPVTCADRQWAVDAMAREPGIFARPERRRLSVTPPAVAAHLADASDAAILDRAFRASNGAAVRRLYRGDRSGHGSASESDMALVSHLLYWTDGDTARADRLFRSSALMRPKWDERRGTHADGSPLTYGERTLLSVTSVSSVGSVTSGKSV